jgi:amidase
VCGWRGGDASGCEAAERPVGVAAMRRVAALRPPGGAADTLRRSMDRDDLAFAGVVKLAELVREREISSRELTELFLGRIERFEPELNAFRVVMAERALTDADQADARIGAGDDRPLLGVPIAVKDCEDVAGEVTGVGTAAHGPPAIADNDFVRRLRAAGAVIVGKTNLPELAIMGTTEGPAFGVTRNPWDVDRTPGGSSGGSGAAVAAGLVPAATATDGAGSIRIPAGACGLVGLKPQRDRIGLAPAVEHWHGLSVAGFVTRTVADTALLLDAVAGPSPEASYVAAAARPPGALRVALSTKPPAPGPVDGEAKAAVDATGDALRSLGHAVERRDPAYGLAFTAITPRYLRGIADDAAAMPRPERLQRRTRGFARIGRLIPDRVLAAARDAEAGHRERLDAIFDDVDVLVTPVAARPPVGAAQWEGMSAPRTLLEMVGVYPYTSVWNMTGQPACAVPAPSLSSDGLPIGVQLVGPPDSEGLLLSLAAQLEAEIGWPARRPPVG